MGIEVTGHPVCRGTAAGESHLKENAVHAVADCALVPLDLPGVLLALVEEERLQDVGRDGVAGQVQVL